MRRIRTALVPAACLLVLLAAVVVIAALRLASEAFIVGVIAVAVVAGCGCVALVRYQVLALTSAVEAEDCLSREWLKFIGSQVAVGEEEIRQFADQMRRGQRPPVPSCHSPVQGDHALAVLARSVQTLQQSAISAIANAVERQQMAAFVNVARRLQSYCDVAFTRLEEVVRDEEDPHRLTELFGADHQITQIRRATESMLVLGGDRPRRISESVSVKAVLRMGIQEICHFDRVQVTEAPAGLIHGFAAADLTHLLAELLENATAFSDQAVTIRAEYVAHGLLIEIDDKGLPIELAQRRRLNELLANPEQFDVAEQLVKDGRCGLFVVARLAQRHGISVRLHKNMYGSNQAAVVLPHALLAPHEEPILRPLTPGTMVRSSAVSESPAGQKKGRHGADDRTASLPSRLACAGAPKPRAQQVNFPQPQPSSAGKPPLPQRRGSYLAPELQQDSPREPAQSNAHNPLLAAGFARGFRTPDVPTSTEAPHGVAASDLRTPTIAEPDQP
ncbi:hypothetical protein [Streptomyces sp. NPDC001037]|uniref:hypothetical protein n=1 Tax=Streptomyces sp. NPDC001037 TaxID=3364542 RepID=UPI0036AC9D9E